jgi:hypothetical protein
MEDTLDGVCFPVTSRDAAGNELRSTSITGQAVLADAMAPFDTNAAREVLVERNWRFRYTRHFMRMVEVSAESPECALGIARSGLKSLYNRFEFVRDGRPHTLAAALDGHTFPGSFGTGFITGGKPKPSRFELGVPYNGGRCANFWWEQTLGDVTINAPVPSGTSARDVVCVIGRSHLTLKLKGMSDPLIDADYPCDARNGQEIWERVKTNECYWSLGESRGSPCVCIYLEKERECWWKSAVHGAEEIDTTKVDSTRDLYTYDDETQGAIRKIMFDQHQKRLGKATSDELKNEDMLRKAWDAEGSPFKGQPFDPSLVNFSGGAGGAPMPPLPPSGGLDEAD